MTKVEELLQAIKELENNSGSASNYRTEMKGLQDQLMQAIENQNKDLDKKFSNIETSFESKIATLLEKVKPQIVTVPAKKEYGNTFGEFCVKVRARNPEIKILS